MNYVNFIKEVQKRRYNVDIGTCKTKLFGNNENEFDENGVKNRELEIFYLVRKGKLKNAPYLIFFNGGPGIAFSDAFLNYDGYKNFLPEFNIVFMDQRGTGFSTKPNDNLYEYQYFTSRYICHDANKIRETILGKNKKWIVFGQSFGGHLVRKYLELYCENALIGVSHGYGECTPVTMKKNIELQLYRQVENYFKKYPNDKLMLEKIKNKLAETDSIGKIRKVYGKDIFDIFAFFFSINSDEKIHSIVQDFNHRNLKEDFFKQINPIGNLVLNSGILNAVVAYIDLLGGITDRELYKQVEKALNKENIKPHEQMFSFMRLSKNVKSISEKAKELEYFLENKKYKIDPVDFSKLCTSLKNNKTVLNIFGGLNDSITPIEAIEEEKELVNNYCNMKNYYKFHYSNGNHREWLHNKTLFKRVFEDLL